MLVLKLLIGIIGALLFLVNLVVTPVVYVITKVVLAIYVFTIKVTMEEEVESATRVVK